MCSSPFGVIGMGIASSLFSRSSFHFVSLCGNVEKHCLLVAFIHSKDTKRKETGNASVSSCSMCSCLPISNMTLFSFFFIFLFNKKKWKTKKEEIRSRTSNLTVPCTNFGCVLIFSFLFFSYRKKGEKE